MKVWILCDNELVADYALKAINALEGEPEIWIANCRSVRHESRKPQHFAYYALNILSMKGGFNRKRPIRDARKTFLGSVDFEARQEGAWQILPQSLIDRINDSAPDIILKFGLGLMRVPPDLNCPILSYHHGNPAEFRGRPAGFWELMTGTPTMGQIIQVLSDKLDAGGVLAYRETRVVSHSLRRTLAKAYALSPSMLNEAIRNARERRDYGIQPTGKNYRLPNNGTVIAFLLKLAAAFLSRLVYGAFFEKAWRVSTAPCSESELVGVFRGEAFPAPELWRHVELPQHYSFIADPFFSSAGDGLYLEAMSKARGIGQILRIDPAGASVLSEGSGHSSYPMTISDEDQEYVVPETVGWRDLTLFQDRGGQLQPVAKVSVDGATRVSDPTLFRRDGRVWLMGNSAEDRDDLRLWHADSLFAPFRRHPDSPVCRGPRGSRMGGRVLEVAGELYRFGQDFSRDYGDGLFCFQITRLDAETYSEKRVGEIRFQHVKGPHTLDWKDGHLLFDWYQDRFSLLAGARRLRYALLRRFGNGRTSNLEDGT